MPSRARFPAETPYNALPQLPPKAELETKPVMKALVGARAALAELKQAGELIPNQSILINTLPVLEARASSEIEKLERWTGDRRDGLKGSLDDLDVRIKEAKKAARFAPSLPEKLRLQREVKTLESRRDEAWRAFDQASRELERDKEKLLDDIERRLTADIRREPLFTLRWRLV
jgi:Fic family protein